jgi:hypothetical protein
MLKDVTEIGFNKTVHLKAAELPYKMLENNLYIVKVPISDHEYLLIENREVDANQDGGTAFHGALPITAGGTDFRVIVYPTDLNNNSNKPNYEYDFVLPGWVSENGSYLGGGLVIWDINDKYVGDVKHNVSSLDSFDSGAGTPYSAKEVTFAMPAVDEGQYFVIVRADIRQDIVEANENNNATASASDNKVDTAVPFIDDDPSDGVNSVLVTSGEVTHAITTDGEYYYRVDVSGGKDLMLTLTCTDRGSFTELFVSYIQQPFCL